MVGEHIHWYITDRCFDDCSYCFREMFPYNVDESRNPYLARILADSDVEKVTIGGGEPTLVNNLVEVVNILKDAGKYVRLHTNGTLLDGIIDELMVDSIALPIDSVDRDIQRGLRGKRFPKTFDRLPELASSILERGIELGWHTVFTAINYQEIPEIYNFIKRIGFDYWSVFEFNDDLALTNAFNVGYTYEKLKDRIKKIEMLKGIGTSAKGYTDSLFGDFLLTEREMKKHGDERIKFAARTDTPTPYVFLENCGDIRYYIRYSNRERRVIGNLIEDGYKTVTERLQKIHEEYWKYNEKADEEYWWATVGNLPLWARLWEGNYFEEEIQEIWPEFLNLVYELSDLHTNRILEHARFIS